MACEWSAHWRNRRSFLEAILLVVVCVALIAGIAITNTAGPSAVAQSSVYVWLRHPTRVALVNSHLAHIGARVRVVPITHGCTGPNVPRLSRLTQLSVKAQTRLRPQGVAAPEAPQGEITVVIASPQGLTGDSYRVHGAAPSCLAADGATTSTS
jgi:hypothetical protein